MSFGLKLGIDVIVRYHELREPIRQSIDFSVADPFAPVIAVDFHAMRDSAGTLLYEEPSPTEKARAILGNREVVARKLAAAILRVLHKLDTENGYQKEVAP